jgi:hypothetical protein
MWIKHRTKIIVVIIAAAVLAGAYFWGGDYSSGTNAPAANDAALTTGGTTVTVPEGDNPEASTDAEASAASLTAQASVTSSAAEASAASDEGAGKTTVPLSDESAGSGKSDGKGVSNNSVESAGTDIAEAAGASTAAVTGSDAEQDQYQTDPVPAGRPAPVEPQDAVVTGCKLTCTISVSCKTILDNIKLLNEDKWELVPKDGVIFAAKTVTFYAGESAFNVLQREMKKAGIQMEYENTPLYNSAYIEGINNLYEFDAGELSGWMYEVNGWFPNYGCSRYQLKDGDVIQWVYTCDLGKDVGGYNSTKY